MRINFPNIYTYNFNIIRQKGPYIQNPIQKDTFQLSKQAFLGKCSPDNFKIKNIKNIRCPICGLVTLNEQQIKRITNDIANKKGEDLASTLEKYEDESNIIQSDSKCDNKHRTLFRPQRQEIVDIIKDLAKQNPSLSLSQLVKLQAGFSIDDLINQQLEVVSKLEEYADCNIESDEEHFVIKSIIAKFAKQIKGEDKTTVFARKRFISALSKGTENEQTRQEIISIASQLPTSFDSVDSFFVKYSHDRTSREIALRLINVALPTTEHLIPKSKKGRNTIENFLCDDAYCNNQRKNTDFRDWQEEIPNLEQNLQDYVNTVQAEIDSGTMPDAYDTYIPSLIKTIAEISDGKIILKVPQSNTDVAQKNTIRRRKTTVERFWKTLKDIEREANALRIMIKELEKRPDFEKMKSVEYSDDYNGRLNKILKALDIINEINQLRQEINEKDDISNYIFQLEQDYIVLIQKIQSIEEAKDFKKSPEHKEYLYLRSLLKKIEDMSQSPVNWKNVSEKHQVQDILDIAKQSIMDKLKELSENPCIKYKLNIAQLDGIEKERAEYKQKLEIIREKEEKVVELEKELETLCGTKNSKIIKAKYQELLDEQDASQKVKSIQELKNKLLILDDMVSYNMPILEKLNKYADMSEEDYISQINLLYLRNNEDNI